MIVGLYDPLILELHVTLNRNKKVRCAEAVWMYEVHGTVSCGADVCFVKTTSVSVIEGGWPFIMRTPVITLELLLLLLLQGGA